MPEGIKSNLLLYADDSYLVFQGKDAIEIEKQLNEGFTHIWEWFAFLNDLAFTLVKIRLNQYFLLINVK